MISAFKHIRLSGYNLTPVSGQAWDGSSQLRLGFSNSGLAYYSELTGISGYLQSLIQTADANVNNLNGLTGAVNITGSDGLTIQVDAGLGQITVVGNSGYFQGLINTLTTNLGTTGATLDTKINTLSGYVNDQDTAISNNLASTGSTLFTRINTLSGYVNDQDTAISNNLASTGSTLATNLASTGSTLATNLASTGSTLNIKVDNLSGYVNATFVKKVNQQVFSVSVPQGIESTGILFPVEFSSIPSTVNVTLETAGDVMYMVGVRSKSTSGYFADFSDVVQENTVKLNTFASNQPS